MKTKYAAVLELDGRSLIMKPNGRAEIAESKEEFEANYEEIDKKQHKD